MQNKCSKCKSKSIREVHKNKHQYMLNEACAEKVLLRCNTCGHFEARYRYLQQNGSTVAYNQTYIPESMEMKIACWK